MLEVVENVHISLGCFSGDNFLILGHVPCLIYFTLMIDLDIDWDAGLLFFGDTGATNSVSVVVQNILFIVPSVFWWFQWDFYLSKYKIENFGSLTETICR